MTLKELIEAVESRNLKGTVNVECNYWRFQPGSRELTYRIWLDAGKHSFKANSPEAALAMLDSHLNAGQIDLAPLDCEPTLGEVG